MTSSWDRVPCHLIRIKWYPRWCWLICISHWNIIVSISYLHRYKISKYFAASQTLRDIPRWIPLKIDQNADTFSLSTITINWVTFRHDPFLTNNHQFPRWVKQRVSHANSMLPLSYTFFVRNQLIPYTNFLYCVIPRRMYKLGTGCKFMWLAHRDAHIQSLIVFRLHLYKSHCFHNSQK